MRIAVIAANGRLGKAFVGAALAVGHSVRAGVRTYGTLQASPRLIIVQCDATNEADLLNLMKDQDIVVSCIGHVKGSKADVQTVATKMIISAMDTIGLKRFVTVTGTGVRQVGDKIPLIDHVANLAIGMIDHNRIEDGRTHVAVLQKSDLEFTAIRVLKLQNTAARPYSLTLNGPTKWFVGREEVASAMLQVIDEQAFIKQLPIMSRP